MKTTNLVTRTIRTSATITNKGRTKAFLGVLITVLNEQNFLSRKLFLNWLGMPPNSLKLLPVLINMQHLCTQISLPSFPSFGKIEDAYQCLIIYACNNHPWQKHASTFPQPSSLPPIAPNHSPTETGPTHQTGTQHHQAPSGLTFSPFTLVLILLLPTPISKLQHFCCNIVLYDSSHGLALATNGGLFSPHFQCDFVGLCVFPCLA